LAISKHLVEMMGGSIGIESREGLGSTFWFTTVFEQPLTQLAISSVASADWRRATGARPLGPLTVPVAAPGSRILIADDNATNRAVALAQLGKLQYQATAVANGAEALEALKNGRFDLVLMDCEMPVMDGYEATRRIRQFNPRVPIVALSAHVMSGDRERSLREGMNDFLSKPVDMRKLSEVLAQWLRHADLAENETTSEPAAPPPAIFNADTFLDRLMGDRELAATILQGFLDDFPSLWNSLRQGLLDRDGPAAHLQAHALKGSAASVSAGQLHDVAGELERAAGAGDWDRFGRLLPRVAEEFDRLKSTLQQSGWLP
jgi:CheY-like chemotaxis protein/HPt (histidine-containing phosphotransfer) domain-containing protein